MDNHAPLPQECRSSVTKRQCGFGGPHIRRRINRKETKQMVLKIVTSSLLLILTSVSLAIAPVAFADPSPAQVRLVCWYAYCKTCGWSGSQHTGSAGEAEARLDAQEHSKNMEKTDKEKHEAQPKSCPSPFDVN